MIEGNAVLNTRYNKARTITSSIKAVNDVSTSISSLQGLDAWNWEWKHWVACNSKLHNVIFLKYGSVVYSLDATFCVDVIWYVPSNTFRRDGVEFPRPEPHL